MFKAFTSANDDEHSISDTLSRAKSNMLECSKKMGECASAEPFKQYLERTGEAHSKAYKNFNVWVTSLAEKDPNWKFWVNFVLRDLSYLSLRLSMRGGLWKLRLGGIKKLAPLFAAFDRPHYQKLIPNHLHDLAKMPSEVISFFESGAFVCSITGGHMHSVALDEAHEMLVNKDLKATIVRPTKEYLDRMLHYYPVRSMVQKALRREVLLDADGSQCNKVSVFDPSPQSNKREENVKCMMTKVQASQSLSAVGETSPLKSMSGQVATPEEEIDLIGFGDVGHKRLENQIKFFILKDPSARVPRRKAKLLTFASTKKVQKKMKRLEKEKKHVGRCLRRAFAWNAKYGSGQQHIGQQYLELPRAISDPSGNLHKGIKSYNHEMVGKPL